MARVLEVHLIAVGELGLGGLFAVRLAHAHLDRGLALAPVLAHARWRRSRLSWRCPEHPGTPARWRGALRRLNHAFVERNLWFRVPPQPSYWSAARGAHTGPQVEVEDECLTSLWLISKFALFFIRLATEKTSATFMVYE
ncbi:uncharacterized protein F4807DRAFT_457848 [Annulohypoxylon truncatum]|uniref:uncharacterized protein n=1 Tax=Annulohypoxylon truncatum TaxID=327061 RepID=UPI002008D6BC|nr:uncharacterized protein F4807DRAFT_457848 [Annulohypoxylon truncatum]KAI1212348.1 hypothetical protein F4807DRAFT_457848 [Annulohypoxylon truncatum]